MANPQRKYSRVTAESRPRTHNLRDRRCQPIGQHKLDPELVKPYAVNSYWAEKYRNALLCQLNSFLDNKEGAA
jgi:hypothetical protein